MAKLPIDLAGFKKTGSDKNSTTLEHKDGHEIKLSHKTLSPKMKEQLQKLVTDKKSVGKEKVAPNKHIAPKKKDAGQAPIAMAEGGKVPGGSGSPAVDKDSAKSISAGASQSGWQPKQWKENLKAAFGVGSPQKMAEGGEVAEEKPLEIEEILSPSNDKLEIEQINREPASALAEALPTEQAPQIPMMAAQNAAPVAAPVMMPPTQANTAAPAPQAALNDPYGYQTTANVYTQGLNTSLGALQQQASAEGAAARNQAAAINQGVQAQQKLVQDYQQHSNALTQEIANITDDYKNGHIDPNHFMASQGTGAKIATGIGLLLGGLGAGATGGKNLALDSLNTMIDRDIDAQKAEMGKKHNLISALNQQYGNLNTATQMASSIQRNILADKIQAAGAQSGDKLAMARAQQAAGQLRMQAAQTVGGLAMKQTLLGGMQQGHVAPEQVIRALVPEAQQGAAHKELAEAQQMAHFKDNALSAFDQLGQINTVGNFVTSPIQTTKQVAALRDPLIAQLSKELAGRFTETDSKFIASLLPNKGDGEDVMATKRAQLNKFISEKQNFPLLKTYGIDGSGMGRYNGQGQSAVKESAPKLGK